MRARPVWLRATRYDMAAEVLFRPVAGGVWTPGRTRAVSRTGMLFETSGAPLPVDTGADVILTLDETNPARPLRVQCRGKVMRVMRSKETGLALVAASIGEYRFLPPSVSATEAALVWPDFEPHLVQDGV